MFCPSPIYIQVTSHLNPGPNICISHPSRWCLSPMCITHPSRSCLTCIQIPISLSHLHPCTVSLSSRSEVSCLICIHVASHLQPNHFHSSHDICITAPSMSYLTPIRISILAPELHPDHVSPPSKSICVSYPSKLPLNPSRYISVPARAHPNPIQVSRCASHLNPCPVLPPCARLPIVSHLHPGRAIFISPSSRSGLIAIQAARLAAQLHPCSISPHQGLIICILPPSISGLTPPRSLNSHLTFIQVRLHLHPGKLSLQDLFLWCRFYFTCIRNFNILISPPSM